MNIRDFKNCPLWAVNGGQKCMIIWYISTAILSNSVKLQKINLLKEQLKTCFSNFKISTDKGLMWRTTDFNFFGHVM